MADELPPWVGKLIELLFNSSVPIALYDQNDTICFANTAFRHAFGLEDDEKIKWMGLVRKAHAKRVGTRIQDEDIEHWLTSAKSRRGKQSFRQFETNLTDGRWLWMTETFLADGWNISIAPDISGLQADEQRVLRMDRDIAIRSSTTDELTGCMNRRGIINALTMLISNQNPISPHSIALLDIDHFKRINDTYGHPTGDAVLRHFVSYIQSRVRVADLLGRYGGEEFLLIFRGSSSANALLILDCIRQDLQPLNIGGERISYSFSGGIADFRVGIGHTQLIKLADEALYNAKREGRARCHVALAS